MACAAVDARYVGGIDDDRRLRADGVDPGLNKDAGRGITNYGAHDQWVAGGADVATAADFVGQRAMTLSSVQAQGERLVFSLRSPARAPDGGLPPGLRPLPG